MSFLQSLLVVASMHFLAVVSPGPDFALMLRNGLAHDRKTALYTALGIASGIWVHVGYCMVGIALLLTQSPAIFKVIKAAGGAYLTYLGGTALFAKAPPPESGEFSPASAPSPFTAWKAGFLCNVLNPKATLFFLGLFTMVLKPGAPRTWQLLYGLEMATATFAWFAFVGFALTHPAARKGIGRFQKIAVKLVGVALIGMGFTLFFRG